MTTGMRVGTRTGTMLTARTKVTRAAVLAGLLLGAAAVPVSFPAAPAAAQAGCDNEVNPQTCHAGAGTPGRTVDLSAEVGPHVSGGEKECISGNPGGHWVDVGPPFASALDFDPGPPPEPGAHYWVFLCPNHINGILNPVNWEGGGWGIAPPEEPPAPEDVLPPLWDEVQARLHAPELALDPPAGEHAVVKVPTFVGILNPQVATRYTATAANSAGSVTVWIDVIPTTTLHPGEPDADGVRCDEDGHAFDDDGPKPEVQAEADSSCTHAYDHVSEAGWEGDVTITWAVTWGSDMGPGGALDAAPSVQPFTRIVDEYSAVVTDFD